MPGLNRAATLLACTLWCCAPWGLCQAGAMPGVTGYCDPPTALSAAQNDQLLRFAAIIKTELEQSGRRVAFIARSGLDLSRFGMRYSHAGVSLKGADDTPWAVRQLYYACNEKRPRIYDQGLSAFLVGSFEPAVGYVSVVLLPAAAAAELERTALDKRQALSLLGENYSANAYPFNVRYQNCNQWVAELLATAWGHLDSAGPARAQAQAWLQGQGYVPTVFNVGWRPLMWLGGLIPWLHSDDHPGADTEQNLYRVSMPASIELLLQDTVPGATRIEFCHNERQVVIHRGWASIPQGCQPGDQDQVITLD